MDGAYGFSLKPYGSKKYIKNQFMMVRILIHGIKHV